MDARNSMIAQIGLAHAKKDLTSKGLALDVRAMVSAGSQKTTSSNAFPSAKRDGATGTSASHRKGGIGLGLSKVLETVDLNDREFWLRIYPHRADLTSLSHRVSSNARSHCSYSRSTWHSSPSQREARCAEQPVYLCQ